MIALIFYVHFQRFDGNPTCQLNDVLFKDYVFGGQLKCAFKIPGFDEGGTASLGLTPNKSASLTILDKKRHIERRIEQLLD